MKNNSSEKINIQQLKNQIAELEKSEERYHTLSEELNESNSLKDLLLDVITHDLKNSIGVIKGFADLGIKTDPNNEIIKEIQSGADCLLKVIDNKILLSKVATGDAHEKDGILTINATDNGDTIEEKDREDIFKRHVQLGKTKGSGLGLAIVKRIADAHNAEIGVKPNRPKGNIFYIKLPAL